MMPHSHFIFLLFTCDLDLICDHQRVSEAYKRLTDPNYVDDEEDGEVDISEEEMFEMFNEMFCKYS